MQAKREALGTTVEKCQVRVSRIYRESSGDFAPPNERALFFRAESDQEQ